MNLVVTVMVVMTVGKEGLTERGGMMNEEAGGWGAVERGVELG